MGSASPVGLYHDPKHGHCLRRIVRAGEGRYKVHGVYGDDEPQTGAYWYADARVVGRDEGGRTELEVDFSIGKPLKRYNRVQRATWVPAERRIEWDDGNRWDRLYATARQLCDP